MNRTSLVFLIFLVCLTGCNKREGQSGIVQYHRMKGLVMLLEPSRNRITIAHEEIPQYMKAMTMPFRVKDSTILRGIEVGDSVRGVVAVGRSEVWLDSLTVIRTIPSPGDRK